MEARFFSTRSAGSSVPFSSASSFGRIFPYAILLLLISAVPAEAWRVVNFARIPGGLSAMTPHDGALWCGFRNGDSTIRVIDPDDGEVRTTLNAPEEECRGLAIRDNSIWFLGRQHLIRMNLQGRVLDTHNLPFARMKGLAVHGAGLWTVVIDEGDARLVQFNLQGGEIRRLAINLTDVGGLEFGRNSFWITEPNGGFIHQLDTTGRTVEIYPTPAYGPRGVSAIEGDIYIVDSGDEQNGDILYKMSLEEEPTPRLLASADYHDYGTVNARGALSWNLGLFNIGGEDLEVTRLSFLNPGMGYRLGEINLPVVVHAGRFAVVSIIFSPSDYGRYSDTLRIECNDPEARVYYVALTGVGVYADRFLAVNPDPIDFGRVRAEPALRDGSRHIDAKFINRGAFELTINAISNNIEDIFALQEIALPLRIAPADTFSCRIWFTPHRTLQYLDTLVLQSNGLAPFTETLLIGQGDALEVGAGEILWQSALGRDAEAGGFGAFDAHADVNGDRIREVVAVGSDGRIRCINGFASGDADILWEQRFDDFPHRPAGAGASSLVGGIYLGGFPRGDVVVGSGIEGTLFGLNGRSGETIWSWNAESDNLGSSVTGILAEEDFDGDDAIDPIVRLVGEDGSSCVVRLNGRTGTPVWAEALGGGELLERLADINGDGAGDYIVDIARGLLVLSGADGSLIRRIDWASGASSIVGLGRPDREAGPMALIGSGEGGIAAVNLRSGRPIWTKTTMPDNTPLATVSHSALYRGLGGPLLAIGDASGNVLVIDDLMTGHVSVALISEQPREVTSIDWAYPFGAIEIPELLVGYDDMTISAYSGANVRWRWDGAEIGGDSPGKVLVFDDVDFGGSADLLVLTEDAVLRCLSSGGDFEVNVESNPSVAPLGFEIITISPNPFNGNAVVEFDAPALSPVQLEVFDVIGRKVDGRVLVTNSAGRQRWSFNAAAAAQVSGRLVFRVQTPGGVGVATGEYIK